MKSEPSVRDVIAEGIARGRDEDRGCASSADVVLTALADAGYVICRQWEQHDGRPFYVPWVPVESDR